MGRKASCDRKNNDMHLYGLRPCQHEFVEEKAAIESIKKGRVVGKSEMVSLMISEKMRGEGYSCDIE